MSTSKGRRSVLPFIRYPAIDSFDSVATTSSVDGTRPAEIDDVVDLGETSDGGAYRTRFPRDTGHSCYTGYIFYTDHTHHTGHTHHTHHNCHAFHTRHSPHAHPPRHSQPVIR